MRKQLWSLNVQSPFNSRVFRILGFEVFQVCSQDFNLFLVFKVLGFQVFKLWFSPGCTSSSARFWSVLRMVPASTPRRLRASRMSPSLDMFPGPPGKAIRTKSQKRHWRGMCWSSCLYLASALPINRNEWGCRTQSICKKRWGGNRGKGVGEIGDSGVSNLQVMGSLRLSIFAWRLAGCQVLRCWGCNVFKIECMASGFEVSMSLSGFQFFWISCVSFV